MRSIQFWQGLCLGLLLITLPQTVLLVSLERRERHLTAELRAIYQVLGEIKRNLPPMPPLPGSEPTSQGMTDPGATGVGGPSSALEPGTLPAGAEDGPRPGGAGTSEGGVTAAQAPAAQVLARLIVLEYDADMALTEEERRKLSAVFRDFEGGRLDAQALAGATDGVLTPDQRAWLGDRASEVEKKAAELVRIAGADEPEYARRALDLLDRPTRQGRP